MFKTIGDILGSLFGAARKHQKLLIILFVGGAAGLALSAVYATAIQYTNTLGFCAHTCHEMESTVFEEYTHSKHFKNQYGVVVVCSQCHVPHNNWVLTMGRKIQATFELWDHFAGTINTPDKFEAHRFELAKKAWAGFTANNARECKACHSYANMLLDQQRPSIQAQHADAMKTNENCLDCHKGLTHKAPVDPAAKPAGFDLN